MAYGVINLINIILTSITLFEINTGFQEFLDQLVSSCSNIVPINTSVFSPPVRVEEPPIYGKKGLSFTDYMGPGIITR